MTTKMENYCKNLKTPDEKRPFKAHGHMDVVTFPEGVTVGRGEFKPGWKWSEDVKPIAGTQSCEAPHSGVCISGSMVIHMNNGDEFTIREGDAFRIPAGHDAWVVGTEPCVLLDVGGSKSYAKKAA